MNVRITPRPLTGCVRAIASKSDAHRALICAAIARHCSTAGENETGAFAALCARFERSEAGFESSEDILATIGCLKALLGAQAPAAPCLDCGESGSTLRFLLPVAAAVAGEASFTGRGRLPERPLGELRTVMEAHGCRFSAPSLPFTVSGRLGGGRYALPGNVSSQYITGLLLALPLAPAGSRIVLTSPLESAAYVEMTLAALARFGVRVDKTEDGFVIAGGQRYGEPEALAVEGDWSNAAFFLTAGMLGGDVTVTGLDVGSAQADRAIRRLLAAFGADTALKAGEARAARGTETIRPQRIDVSAFPDLFPILAVAACGGMGDTVLENAARLRLKESDRITSTAQMISALGGSVSERADALILHGRGRLLGGTVESCGDHRIAMAAAAASVLCTEPVVVRGAEAVRKSYPRFFEDFQQLGGIADVI